MRGSSVIMAALLGASSARVDETAFESARQGFVLSAQDYRGSQGFGQRRDAADSVPNYGSYRAQLNRRRIEQAIASRRADGRKDGFSSTAGMYLARDLQYIVQEVLTEQFPVPNAFRIFTLDETIPVGATSYVIRREYSHGEARVWRGPGDEVPRVGTTQREEEQAIRHIVSGFAWDVFEALSDRFANKNRVADGIRIARDVIMELQNRIWWQGAPQHGLYGVLNYPWLPKMQFAQSFSAAAVAAAPDTYVRLLNTLCNYPRQVSKGIWEPDTLCLTQAVHDVLSTTPRSTTSDTTVLEYFLRNSKVIKRVEICWELEQAGGATTDGMLACRTDQRGIRPVLVQGVAQLPVREQGLESLMVNYASMGGVRIMDPKCNVLGLVPTV